MAATSKSKIYATNKMNIIDRLERKKGNLIRGLIFLSIETLSIICVCNLIGDNNNTQSE